MSVAADRISTPPKVPRLQWPLLWTLGVVGLLVWGSHAHLERYITPQRGVGYWLGITGGSMMLLLLMYSARKRAAWLRWLGGIPAWFELHMLLGIVGPILVLFHSNFSLGATNSNVALFSMLLVAGSGLIGRYIYTRLPARRDGHQQTLEHLKATDHRLRLQSEAISFLPGLLDAIDRVERRWIEPPTAFFWRFPHLCTGGVRVAIARWLIRRETQLALNDALEGGSAVIARRSERVAVIARRYAERRLEANRRIAEYHMYERLLSGWHLFHIPLFFMLLIAGIVHVIAVNVY